MADLFPTSTPTAPAQTASQTQVNFGSSFRFDFDAGEFLLTPSGRFLKTDSIDAWVEWCRKALMTARYRFLVYSRDYGQEFESLLGKGLTRKAIESELKRMATECLMADPRTAEVKDFTFTWGEAGSDQVFFTCTATNVLGESSNLNGSAVMRS